MSHHDCFVGKMHIFLLTQPVYSYFSWVISFSFWEGNNCYFLRGMESSSKRSDFAALPIILTNMKSSDLFSHLNSKEKNNQEVLG